MNLPEFPIFSCCVVEELPHKKQNIQCDKKHETDSNLNISNEDKHGIIVCAGGIGKTTSFLGTPIHILSNFLASQ